MVALVSYDLRQLGRDYESLYSLLKSVPYDRPLESVWFVRTSLSTQALSDKIKLVIDANDRFLVMDVSSSDYGGWLAKTSWDWLRLQSALR